MSSEEFAYERPQMTIRLEREAGEGEGQLDLANQAIAALGALSDGWLEPLAWEMYVGCLDTDLMHATMECDPPQEFWLLRQERVPAEIEIDPIYGNHTVATEPVLSCERLHAWVARALAQTCAGAPRVIPYWESFYTLAMQARLPEATCSTSLEALSIECYAGTITMPVARINDQAWISGAPERYVIGPPVSVTAGNFYGMMLNLDLAVYWSPWLEQPGRAMVDAAVERVLALGRGWRYEE